MRVLIGIDDTDNLESRGTGYRARQLGALLAVNKFVTVEGITRHQLLVDSRIPYTSHNSSACLVVNVKAEKIEWLRHCCRDYLLQESALGADTGLCMVAWEDVDQAIQNFGSLAKTRVLTQKEALGLISNKLWLQGLTGTKDGIIGALAAVGLRAAGNDGRFIWLRHLRELSGIYTPEQLLQVTGIDEVRATDNNQIPDNAHIEIGDWPRPILKNGRSILLVKVVNGNGHCRWRVADKEHIKQISN
jgi:hypothetical protein